MSLSESLSVFICFCRFYQLFVKQTCRPRYWNLFWMKSRCFPLSDIRTSVCTWLPVWTPRIELLLLNSSHADLYGKSWEQLIYLRCVCSICQRHFSDAFLERILCDGDRSLVFIIVLLAIDLLSSCYALWWYWNLMIFSQVADIQSNCNPDSDSDHIPWHYIRLSFCPLCILVAVCFSIIIYLKLPPTPRISYQHTQTITILIESHLFCSSAHNYIIYVLHIYFSSRNLFAPFFTLMI